MPRPEIPKTAHNATPDRRRFADAMRAAGWTLYPTGGNCTAWTRTLATEPRAEWWLVEEAQAPATASEKCCLYLMDARTGDNRDALRCQGRAGELAALADTLDRMKCHPVDGGH